MTVAELIAELQKLPPEWEAVVGGEDASGVPNPTQGIVTAAGTFWPAEHWATMTEERKAERRPVRPAVMIW